MAITNIALINEQDVFKYFLLNYNLRAFKIENFYLNNRWRLPGPGPLLENYYLYPQRMNVVMGVPSLDISTPLFFGGVFMSSFNDTFSNPSTSSQYSLITRYHRFNGIANGVYQTTLDFIFKNGTLGALGPALPNFNSNPGLIVGEGSTKNNDTVMITPAITFEAELLAGAAYNCSITYTMIGFLIYFS